MKRAETPTAGDVRTVRLFIADDWAAGDAPAVTLTSPATGTPIARIEQASRADVDRAVAAAQRAVERLERMTVFERAALCHRVADLLLERKEEIAADLSLEQGKPYRSEAVPEVEVTGGMFRDAAECAKRLDGAVIPSADPAKRVLTLRQARGVYGIVTPWNYPVAIPSEYLGPGLATGNAMVWKPSEWTPLSAWHLMRCIADAGAPAGAVSLLQGAPQEIGDAVVSHPQVVAIGLTGSSHTGQIVAQRAAGKPMLLELGGNGPTIVFDDADLERAVARTAYGCFANAGQDIHPPQEDRVHGEAGRRPGCQWPAGAGTTASWLWRAGCRVKAVGAQHPSNRAGRHPNGKAQQLAVDALAAPPGVLAGKPDDELLDVGERRPSRVGGRVGPASPNHALVPAQQRLGPHQEDRPARPWEQPAERREQRTVGGLQPGLGMLTAQHRKLVA
jgi:Aldehyde dehydrogenase family